MQQFIQNHRDCIVGVLHGFDRLLFRGTLRSVSFKDGLAKYLNANDVLLKNFDVWAHRCTDRLCRAIESWVKQQGRLLLYLSSAAVSKEQLALEIASADNITSGLVACFTCVEPCYSPEIHRGGGRLQLRYVPRKCKHYYLYLIDPDFGWMHIRIASWIPFDVQICLNGRNYLRRQLDRSGIACTQHDNCFTQIADLAKAQELMGQLLKLNWAVVLRKWLAKFWPAAESGLLPEGPERYYWSIRQSEVATDVMFKDAASLAAIYPRLCRHGIEGLSCQDVMRFFNKQPSRGSGQVTSTCQRLVQGMRLKHRLGNNWIKMYDKAGCVLRIETTINDPHSLKVFRGPLSDPKKNPAWREMAKAVADIHRRYQLCQSANERYLDALAAVGPTPPAAQLLDPVSQPLHGVAGNCRGLRPTNPDDAALFAAVMAGQNLIDGFSNAMLQQTLFAKEPCDKQERRRRSNAVGRKLRLLRRHGLIHKIGRRRLYRLTVKGRQLMSLALAIRQNTTILATAA